MTTFPPYPVQCPCGEPARYKIASTWSDGVATELKTYALCCEGCLMKCYQDAKQRQAGCPLEFGETLAVPCIYERGSQLQRRIDQERKADNAACE